MFFNWRVRGGMGEAVAGLRSVCDYGQAAPEPVTQFSGRRHRSCTVAIIGVGLNEPKAVRASVTHQGKPNQGLQRSGGNGPYRGVP